MAKAVVNDVVAHSATLAINERLAARRAAGEPVVHLGFGEAGLPVLPSIVNELFRCANRNGYGPVVGSGRVREAAAGYFTRRGLPTTADQVITAPGSKALLYALIAALPGDVVLPRPSWVTYAAQAALADRRVIWVDVPDEAGGVPDPDLLAAALQRSRKDGMRPGVLVLTLPDNPTGTVASADTVKRVCEVAEHYQLAVISDEIYRDLAYQQDAVASPAEYLPDRCFVSSGLSKSMALGGWRIGFTRVPDSELGTHTFNAVVGIASEVWSSLAGPMQEVAAYVLDEPAEITEHVAASRRLHSAVSTAVHREFTAAGASCREPAAAFYLYPDLAPLTESLARQGVAGSDAVAEHLLDRYGIGVLSGAAFGDNPEALRFRVATSLLYGDTDEQRWEALRTADPTALPWIADSVARVRAALDGLGL